MVIGNVRIAPIRDKIFVQTSYVRVEFEIIYFIDLFN